MADEDTQITDKPVDETKTEEPIIEEPKAEEPVSNPTAPTSTDQMGRQLYDVTCAKCGKPAQVPFKPSGDRPVYCKECYAQQRKER